MTSAGMDIARLNFSHGTCSEHLRSLLLIRKLNLNYHRQVKILIDLEGNRVRIGNLPDGGIAVKKNQQLVLSNNPHFKKAGHIPFDYEGSLHNIKRGNHIFIDDGTIDLLVKKSTRDYIATEVIIPGTIKKHKGINIPNADLQFDGLSGKDRTDIQFGIDNKVDYFAQSFVRYPSDIIAIKELIETCHPPCKIIAKIENREGIENAAKILDVADGLMIARGDMGISIPIYQVPIVQKQLIRLCNKRKKIVITATQMLESMTEHLMPTRAEVTDVANAVFDGTDMVMLSGETAVGKHPVETVHMMKQILRYTEHSIKANLKKNS
jgi:pyruvate kinase